MKKPFEVTDGHVRLKIIPKKMKGLYEIIPVPFKDWRGYMCRLFDREVFDKAGLRMRCVQESRSYTKKKNTIRGFHVSLPPHLEGKTGTCIRGRVMWVCIDVRKNSPTFGQWDTFILSDKLNNMFYAEPGFAHGNLTLTDNVDLLLRAENYFHQGTGIKWDDPDLKVKWNLKGKPLISARDKNYPTFKEFKKQYDGV
jgi:dTDP-4-dehydrorhamnose 3,5-epimerase